MATHITSLTSLAKKNWFKTVIDSLVKQGYTKARIAEALGITPQRLTNISNGTFAISDKMVDTIVATFGLGDITISTNNHSSMHVDEKENDVKGERLIDRLDTYLLLCGVAEEQLIVSARLQHDTLNKVRSEETTLSKKQIDRILSALPDMNKEWLLKGEGNMKNGNAIPMIEKKGPLARILQLLGEEEITLEEFARSINSNVTLFDNAIRWPYDSRSLILGNDKAIRSWVNAFCDVFPKYSKFWILTGKTSKYNYPFQESE